MSSKTTNEDDNEEEFEEIIIEQGLRLYIEKLKFLLGEDFTYLL